MNGLLVGGVIGEGLKSFVNSYNATQDRQRQQAESDETRAMRRRQMKFEETKEGVDYDPETESYSTRPGFNSKRELEMYDKDLSDLRAQYGLLTEDQKQGTEEGRGLLAQIGELQNKVSGMRRGTGSGMASPAPTNAPALGQIQSGGMLPASPTTQTPPTKPIPSGPQPLRNTVAPTAPQGNAPAKPKGLLGGFTPVAGYKSKSERDTEKAVATARATQLATGSGATEMRKEFIGQQAVKDMQGIATSFDKVLKASQDNSPAGDLSLIYGFMRMQDPASTVREGEFATAQNAAGVPEKLRNMYNKAVNGERLNDTQRADFANQAANLYEANLGQFTKLKNSYNKIASKQGFDPEAVTGIYSFDAPVRKKKAETKGATQGSGVPNFDNMSTADLKKFLGTK